MDPVTAIRNANAIPVEQMRQYIGQTVAWSPDGKQVLAHNSDGAALLAELDQRGIVDFILEYIPELYAPPPRPTRPAEASGPPPASAEAAQ